MLVIDFLLRVYEGTDFFLSFSFAFSMCSCPIFELGDIVSSPRPEILMIKLGESWLDKKRGWYFID